jgi:2-keto-4-pentenoate hydratase/2-oxohepta-3-ene-1,7-dioic acid hydratase in catechol pathway
MAVVGGRAVLVHDGSYHDLEAASSGALGPDPMAAVADHRRLHDVAAGLADRAPDGALADVALGAPVPRPRNVFAIGLNYRAHAAESGMTQEPAAPVVFTKFPSCICAPGTDVVLEAERVDYEVELVVVIGTGGKGIAASDAWSHVAGATGGQDISDRDLQFAATPAHFDLAKSRDTYGPIGPVLVSPDAFADPDDITLTCEVNGERRQHASTRDMFFDVPTLVAYLSSILTLHPGDLIFTGTPAGVGMARGEMLRPGDVITSTVEGVGSFTNRCV